MKIGLIDVDGHNYPNLVLMKISAYHKAHGDTVEWYEPLFGGQYDRVYMSKVFSFTPDYVYVINAKEVIKGGTGYQIKINKKGHESFEQYELLKQFPVLDYDIEHMYPDYSLYPELTKDTAYGFLTRGCPRNCGFCHVTQKEGKKSVKVANLSEFWDGQKNIVIMDPNFLACPDHEELFTQLKESKAFVDFNQGLDIRLLTGKILNCINRLKIKNMHFAWDRYKDKDIIIPKLQVYAESCAVRPHGRAGTVYILTNYGSTMKENEERIRLVDYLGYAPYVMIYQKETAPPELRRLQRWCNNPQIFRSCPDFKDYKE